MTLTHWGFIYTAAGSDFARTVVDTPVCRSVFMGVGSPADGAEAARRLVEEGAQLIELCGGFGPVWAGRIIEAIGGAVPVGVVGYGPEAVDGVHRIFADV
jgi:predicted polyphosphate/ATP-dependent NAD kinase